MRRARRVAAIDPATSVPVDTPSARPAQHISEHRREPVASRPPPTPRISAAPPPPSIPFERKQVRKLVKGHDAIAARIDLHGAREADAYIRLTRFILRCVSDGHRIVLVVTGKGRADRDGSDTPWLGGERRQPGILRRNVPRWLAEPELAPYVISFTAAHPRHGGEGALYVRLRRLRD